MTDKTQRSLFTMSAAPSNDPLQPRADIGPALGEGCTTGPPEDSPLLPKLKPLRAPRQSAAVALAVRKMYRASNAILSPPSFNSDDRNDFLDLLTKLAAGFHPQDLLSKASFRKSAGDMTEADLITHLARYAAHSWGISDKEIALERKMTVLVPEKVGDELGVVVVDENGWMRLAKESASQDLRLAINEDNPFSEDDTQTDDNSIPDSFESRSPSLIDDIAVHPPISVKEPSVITSRPTVANLLAFTDNRKVATVAKAYTRAKSIEESKAESTDQLHTNKSPAKRTHVKQARVVKSQKHVIWSLEKSHDSESSNQHPRPTVQAPQQVENELASTKKRKFEDNESESS